MELTKKGHALEMWELPEIYMYFNIQDNCFVIPSGITSMPVYT